MVVNRGTTELNIEVTPLSSSVCASAKRKGGKNELSRPAITNHLISLDAMVLKLLNPNRKRKREAKTMRRPPNCMAENPKRERLIRINEEPQINESKIK
jgi:hypothetical protein